MITFGPVGALRQIYNLNASAVIKKFFVLLRRVVPAADILIKSKIGSAIHSIQKDIVPTGNKVYERLPLVGYSESQMRTEIARYKDMDDMFSN